MRKGALDLGLIALGYAALALLVSPWHGALLDDSWMFALAADEFERSGRLFFIPYSAPAPAAHILWGVAVRAATGGGVAALNLSNYLDGALTAMLLYALARLLGATRPLSLLGAALWALSPTALNVSLGFMADVDFVFWALATAILYVLSLRDPRWAWGAGLMAAVAVVERPHGVLLPAAAAAFLLLARREHRLPLWAWFALLAPPAVAAVGAGWWWTARVASDPIYEVARVHRAERWEGMVARLREVAPVLRDAALRPLYFWLLAGLWTLPLSAAVLARGRAMFPALSRPALRVAALAAAGGAAAAHFALGTPFPYFDSVLDKEPGILAPNLWAALGVLAIPGAAAAAALGVRALAGGRWRSGAGLALMLAAAQLAALAPLDQAFDRYYLAAWALALPALLAAASALRPSLPAALGALALVAAFSISANRFLVHAHDAAWREAERLVEEGLPPDAVDAGFPWAGYHAYLPSHRAPGARRATTRDRWYVQEYAWAMEVRRVLAFSRDDPARYEVIREVPLGALFGRPRTLYVLGYR